MDPSRDERRIISSLNALDDTQIGKLIDEFIDNPKAYKPVPSDQLITADPETIKRLVKEFSGISFMIPEEGLRDIQCIETAEFVISLLFMEDDSKRGVIVGFELAAGPGELPTKALSVPGMTVCLVDQNGNIIPGRVRGDSQAFVLYTDRGSRYELKLEYTAG